MIILSSENMYLEVMDSHIFIALKTSNFTIKKDQTHSMLHYEEYEKT